MPNFFNRNVFVSGFICVAVVKESSKMAHYKGAASEAGRAMHLMKKREKAQQEIEFRKKKIEEDLKISNIENKFAAHYDAVEQQLKVNIIWNYINIMFNIVHCVAAFDLHRISGTVSVFVMRCKGRKDPTQVCLIGRTSLDRCNSKLKHSEYLNFSSFTEIQFVFCLGFSLLK